MAIITPPYHFALVVEDVEQAKEDLGKALGLTWAKTQLRSYVTETRDGRKPGEMCYAYSLQGPPYLELLELRPGTIFDRVGLHHIGLWTDDRAFESARLDSVGWPREAVTVNPDGTWGGGLFHTGICGLRLEVVDIATSGPRLVRYLGGGDYRPEPSPR
jgi:hypothetical protein